MQHTPFTDSDTTCRAGDGEQKLWIHVPHSHPTRILRGIGCVLIRDVHLLKEAFAVRPEYLKDLDSTDEEVNFYNYGIQLSRSIRALKLWMSLKVFGLNAFRKAVARGFVLAEFGETLLRASPH